MNQYDEFMKVLKALEEHNVNYILIGGFAVFLHGFKRFTQDIDLFIKMIPENIDHLHDALHSIFDDPSIDEITIKDLSEYQVVRYGTTNNFYIDIIAQLGVAVSFEDLACEIIEYQGVKIKIASPETLYNMKKNTVRPQDKQDSMFLYELIKSKEGE